MGLSDLLASVLRLKTADALEQVRSARARVLYLMDEVEVVIDEDFRRATGPGGSAQDLRNWAMRACARLSVYQSTLRSDYRMHPAMDTAIEGLDAALGSYLIATRALLDRGPDTGLPLIREAQHAWVSAKTIARAVSLPDPRS